MYFLNAITHGCIYTGVLQLMFISMLEGCQHYHDYNSDTTAQMKSSSGSQGDGEQGYSTVMYNGITQ